MKIEGVLFCTLCKIGVYDIKKLLIGLDTYMKKVLKYGAIALVVIIVLAIIGGSGDTDTSSTDEVVNNQSSTRDETGDNESLTETDNEVMVYALNEDVIVEDRVRWKIISAENIGQTLQSSNQFIDDETTTGKFIRIKGEVENVSGEQLSFSAPKLVDSQEREFSEFSSSFSFIPEDEQIEWYDNFNPNITRAFTEIYEVSSDAEGLKFEVTNLGIFNLETEYIELEL